ncbi:hypothetical protein [Streptomyces misionensis]|uniref:hypothetical protein n=1 Tax=Streptomyces misionensis TaxID=67331 RepID=UPI0036B196FA
MKVTNKVLGAIVGAALFAPALLGTAASAPFAAGTGAGTRRRGSDGHHDSVHGRGARVGLSSP